MSREAAPEAFPKSLRLRRRGEFRRVQSRGRRIHTPHFLIILHPRPDGGQKLGITVTKKVGTAVQRNRVKRLVREVFRHHRRRFPADAEVVVIAKRDAPTLGQREVAGELLGVERAMHAALRRANRNGGARR
ncbi:MAG: ribonuclease P protein component [Myxococcota bacterium]